MKSVAIKITLPAWLQRVAAAAVLALGIPALAACGGKNAAKAEATADSGAPALQTRFTADADSLFAAVEAQTSLGPRTPGSAAHGRCADMIVGRLKSYGIDSVARQMVAVTPPVGGTVTARNILGCINPDASNRILLLAHYDTRPTADNDPDPALRSTPIDGANDGASGVAVLLEIARLLGSAAPDSIGIDLLFTDVEDSGTSGGGEDSDATWCLGTREWVKQMPYSAQNKPRYGVLLDMVGGRGARFHREYFSDRSAPAVVNRIWAVARESGFADRFVNEPGGAVVDDHLPVNNAGIPCIDIIESLNEQTGSFNPTWHTTADRLDVIDRESLRAVAQTLLNAIIKP